MKNEKRKFGLTQIENTIDKLTYVNEEYTTQEKKQIAMDLYLLYLNKHKQTK